MSKREGTSAGLTLYPRVGHQQEGYEEFDDSFYSERPRSTWTRVKGAGMLFEVHDCSVFGGEFEFLADGITTPLTI
jgi:hypothetical protein